MGHHKSRYMHKLDKQLVNKQENERYYQNGTAQKSPRTENERNRDRKLES